MTKDEFITGYMAASMAASPDMEGAIRTADGFWAAGFAFEAQPCDCRRPTCCGWQMSSRPASAPTDQNAPKP